MENYHINLGPQYQKQKNLQSTKKRVKKTDASEKINVKKSKMTVYSPMILFISLFVWVAAFKLWEKYVFLNPNAVNWSSLKGFILVGIPLFTVFWPMIQYISTLKK